MTKEWITQAMERAFHQLKDVDLDVRIVTYAGADTLLVRICGSVTKSKGSVNRMQ